MPERTISGEIFAQKQTDITLKFCFAEMIRSYITGNLLMLPQKKVSW